LIHMPFKKNIYMYFRIEKLIYESTFEVTFGLKIGFHFF